MSIACLLTALFPEAARAVALNQGDIIVNTQNVGAVYKIDPVSGTKSVITSGDALASQSHLIFDDQGRILTAVRGGTSRGIVRIDASTGTQTVIASGTLLNYPTSMAFDQSNNLIVGNCYQNNKLVRVDMQTGVQSLITAMPTLYSIQDVDVDSQGQVVVLDSGYVGGGKIVRVDPATGQQALVASGGYLYNPSDLLIDQSGDFIVANKLANRTTQILDINSNTGAQTLLMTLPSEGWIAFQDQEHLYYADFNGNLSILSADLRTGQTQTVAKYSVSGNIVGIAVYSPVPEPSTLVLLAMGTFGLVGLSWRCRRKAS
jgi:6-phosphogluconolactonase (cycloisomerase 2 family)